MKKLQPKIFIDNEVSLLTGYTLSTGYSIGQTIHFNDTGNEYLHKLDGVWVSNTTIISPVFTDSTSEIILDCVNNVQYDTNNGSTGETGATISFSNLPEVSCEKLLIVNNERSEPFTLILPEDFTSGGNVYSIKKMLENPIIPIGGSAELRMLFIKKPPIPAIKQIKHGRLYNWYAASDVRGIAPTGWHVSTNDEWTTLINYIGGEENAGTKLKSSNENYWQFPSVFGTDDYGFGAKANGFRFYDGSSDYLNSVGYWWTSTNDIENPNPNYAFACSIGYKSWLGEISRTNVRRYVDAKFIGFSIRCVRDNDNTETTVTDIDGNNYTSVTIGTQTWLVQDLAVTKFKNGEQLPQFSGFDIQPGVVSYNNDENNVYDITSQEVNECEIRLRGNVTT